MKERTRVKKHKDNFMGNRATYALSGSRDDSIAGSRWELLFFRIKAIRRFWNLDSTAFAPSQRLKAIMSGLAPSSLGNTYFLFYGRKKKSNTNERFCYDFKQLLGQWYSNFSVHPNCLGILLKCRFWSRRSGASGSTPGGGFASWARWAERS